MPGSGHATAKITVARCWVTRRLFSSTSCPPWSSRPTPPSATPSRNLSKQVYVQRRRNDIVRRRRDDQFSKQRSGGL